MAFPLCALCLYFAPLREISYSLNFKQPMKILRTFLILSFSHGFLIAVEQDGGAAAGHDV